MTGDSRRVLRLDQGTDQGSSVVQGTKRRRVDRLIDAATLALDGGRQAQALATVAEIASLDPNNPQLAVLKTRLGHLARPESRHPGRWMGAAAMMVCGAFASYITYHAFEKQDSPQTPSSGASALTTQFARPVSAVPGLSVVASTPYRLQDSVKTGDGRVLGERSAKGTAGSPLEQSLASSLKPAAVSRRKPLRSATRQPTTNGVATEAAAQESLPAAAAMPVATSSPLSSESAPVSSARSPDVPALPASATNALTAIPATSTTNDERLVRGVLQRYREAYADLDARAARAVWPRVDEVALARAFDGLRSQQITFNDCNLELDGEAASAKCRGSMRYVPKIGSADPRIEPRVWNFSLRKQGTDWTIESARAER
jgi:hypothetical protein